MNEHTHMTKLEEYLQAQCKYRDDAGAQNRYVARLLELHDAEKRQIIECNLWESHKRRELVDVLGNVKAAQLDTIRRLITNEAYGHKNRTKRVQWRKSAERFDNL